MWERDSLKDEDHPTVPLNLTEKTLIRRFPDKDTVIEGRLLGGCLDCLANLVGTEYDKVGEFADRYREDGIIWFLEACELNVMTIRRTLWNLKNAGWFKHVKGFLVGRPLCFGEECFTRYVDLETGEYVADDCGKCDHTASCGYHYPPRQYFHDHPELSCRSQRTDLGLCARQRLRRFTPAIR